MSATETAMTNEDIKFWSTKDTVICELSTQLQTARFGVEPQTQHGLAPDGINISGQYGSGHFYMRGFFPVLITRFSNDNNRKIGYIAGVNSDGSFNIYVLGNGSFNASPTHHVTTIGRYEINGDTRELPPSMYVYLPEHTSDFGPFYWITDSIGMGARYGRALKSGSGLQYVTPEESFAYSPQWRTGGDGSAFSIVCCAKQGNDYVIDGHYDNITLTNNIDSTLHLGVPLECNYWQRSQAGFYYGDKNIGGDLHDLFDSITISTASSVANMPANLVFSEVDFTGATGSEHRYITNTYPPFNGTMAFHYTPYNLILTYDLEQARNYVTTGELPTDAFIYPFDVDNIPTNTSGNSGPDGSDGTQPDDTPDTGGNSGGEDTDNAPPRKPTTSAQALTNNNLYWLTSLQLKNFINWFWTDATDVTNPQELFEKIQGLYSDLSQAIVAIRFMPVDPSWIGGVTLDTKIIVGLVEKEEQVQTINKTVADIRTIGEIEVTELEDFKGFINYSPYCQMSLYLPFYGFIDLDCDLLMPNDKRKNTNKLKVYATYDILSGTIQYFIYRVSSTGNENMINCVSAKMAVDIPISLQTKTERDSMIFNNVSSATANLIGAGASVATGNPIGLVMSTASIAGQQSSGAPMRVMGTIGESGAFYDDGHCALYIKRPATNYPPQYSKRIGYPYNAKKKLSEISGFVQCQNPYISFSHVTAEDSDGFPPPKPTAEEIDTIYAALQEGVYLP